MGFRESFPSAVDKGRGARRRTWLTMAPVPAALLAWATQAAQAAPLADPMGAPQPAVACGGGWSSTAAIPATPATPLNSKFQLAEAACGGWVTPADAPREAAQLALYERRQEHMAVLSPAAGSTAGPAAGPVTRAAAARPAPGGVAVQRIRALVPAVAQAARRHGIDPLLLHAVAHVESRHQAAARSPAGARGVMQVMPATARRFGLDDPQRELHVAELNIDVGAEYLKTLQRRFGNDLTLVLAAYNAGEGAVEKYGRRIPPYPETQAYVRQVLTIYAELRRRLGAAAQV